MPWGVSEGGVPQPYRIQVENAYWEPVRNNDGELVKASRSGEPLMRLTLEGRAWRLEDDGGELVIGEEIEPVDGKHNRRGFLIGDQSQWIDPREDGKKIESVRSKDDMPWARSELGQLIKSLIDLVGTDTLDEWGDWHEADSWAGRTYDMVPVFETNDDGEPITYKTRSGEERQRMHWAVANVEEGESKGGSKSGSKGGSKSRGRSRRKKGDGVDLEAALRAEWEAFTGDEDEFLAYVEGDDFEHAAEVAKLSDDEFDELMDKVIE